MMLCNVDEDISKAFAILMLRNVVFKVFQNHFRVGGIIHVSL